MDYPSFLELHELLKDGIEEYVRKEVTSTNTSANEPFYRKNGKITTQIRLAYALGYFAGGSYLDIIMSHSVGKTDFYRSIWVVVHAMNECSSLDFQFPSTLAECQSISNEFSLRSKAGFTNGIGCIDGLLIWLENHRKTNALKSVSTAENFFVDERENLVSIFKEFVMPDKGSHIFPSNIQCRHPIIWLLSLLLYMVI